MAVHMAHVTLAAALSGQQGFFFRYLDRGSLVRIWGVATPVLVRTAHREPVWALPREL